LQNLAFGILVLLAFSCETISFGNKIETGTIVYEITYPEIPKNSYMLDLLPQEMNTMFKNGSYRSDIIAGMGLFKTSIISLNDDEHLLHSVKLLNKKKASKLTSAEIKSFNPHFNELEVEFLDETKEIAGYKCKTAQVKVLSDSSWDFKVYYYTHFGLEAPNKHSPFNEIDGVLMEYEIMSYDTHMKFTAQKVTIDEVDESSLVLEEGYDMISPDELRRELESIFEKVK